jgi:circadian clock protein KaiB
MKRSKKKISPGEFDISGKKLNDGVFKLSLYVTGMTPHSLKAIKNLKEICENNLNGRYILEIIDLYKNPELAKDNQIIAAPTLIKKLPLPLRRIIGDMSNTERVIVGLDIKELKK